MVTEHENLKFRYFSFLFIIFVTKDNRMHVYILSKKLLKRNTNDYNNVMMYLGHIRLNGPTAEKALNFDILAVSLLLVLLNAITFCQSRF